MPSDALSWLYTGLACILAASGIALLIWALVLDRARGRRRCPRCWYDMSATPGRQCSECGRTARSERRLQKTRRRWRWLAPALLLLVAAYGAHNLPRYRARGWTAFIPSSLLVYIAPVSATSPAPPLTPPRAPGTAPLTDPPLTREVWARLQGGTLSLWQSQAYLARVIAALKADPGDGLRVPPIWPVGVDVPCTTPQSSIAGLNLKVGSPGEDREWNLPGQRTWVLSAITTPSRSTIAEVSLHNNSGLTVYRSQHTLPIDATIAAEAFLERINTPETTAEVQTLLTPHLAERENRIELILFHNPGLERSTHFPFILAFTCEVRAGDRVIAFKSDDAPWRAGTHVVWSASRLDWPPDALDLLRRGEATITIRGDYAGALKVYTKSPFDPPARACWTGEFSAPLSIKPHPRGDE